MVCAALVLTNAFQASSKQGLMLYKLFDWNLSFGVLPFTNRTYTVHTTDLLISKFPLLQAPSFWIRIVSDHGGWVTAYYSAMNILQAHAFTSATFHVNHAAVLTSASMQLPPQITCLTWGLNKPLPMPSFAESATKKQQLFMWIHSFASVSTTSATEC